MRAVYLLMIIGCGAQPPPVIGALSPRLVCGAGTLPVSLSGDHFFARPVRTVAGTSALEVPRARLVPMSGDAVEPEVIWLSTQELTLEVPLDSLSAGKYALALDDPDGQSARAEDALERVEVPPISVDAVTPMAVCLDGDRMLQVSGTGFVAGATVTVLDAAGRTVAEPQTTLQGNQIRFTLPSGTLPPGHYMVVVENPAQAGCAATASAPLDVDAPPTLTAAQGNVCSDGGVLTLTGGGLLPGATVTLTEGMMTISGRVISANGTSAMVRFDPNNLPKNSFGDLSWQNPDGCAVTLKGGVRVKPGNGGCQ